MGDRVRKALIAASITLSTAGLAAGIYGHYLQYRTDKEREARLQTLVDKYKACPGRLMKVPYCYSLGRIDELRKEAEAILDKHLKGLNAAAEIGNFEPLTNKLNQALNKITETSRRDFEKLFVKKDLSLEKIKKLQTNFATDPSLDANEKGRLTGLQKELIAYLVKQYELKENKARLIEETQDTLKRIMNPASHATLIPLYESELKNAIAGVRKLKEYLDA